jgi:oxepin-CoA hydrolase/3-oxo-5,6-dehydrosuberyl-CoA semialdehyde dehydrogenase
VAFTGSADTAARLRSHPTVLTNSVRFTAEADSLNCSILGPDVAPGSAEFDLYIREIYREMTVKAGQKCTAIRRALVPFDRTDEVLAALRERLAKVVIGDPSATVGRWGRWPAWHNATRCSVLSRRFPTWRTSSSVATRRTAGARSSRPPCF